ncbi:MAG: hypothetical protein H0T42_25270 [Deltaproteobacteria bacterium]|nr:hypothetical protein [Deltaproteobacteria bacterium]
MRSPIILVLTCAFGAEAQAETQPAEPWAVACGEAMTAARARVAKVHTAFKRASVSVAGPVDLPARSQRGGKPFPPVHRAGSAVHVDLQLRHLPEYFYTDVIDVRDDKGGWASGAGDGAWSCHERRSDSQRNLVCTMRVDEHIAIVRSIRWRATSARVTAYMAAFQDAGAQCVRPAPVKP